MGLLDKTLYLKYTHTQTHSQPPPKQIGVLTENIWTDCACKIADEIPEITTYKLCWGLLRRVEKRYHKLWSAGINLDKHQTICHSVKVFREWNLLYFTKGFHLLFALNNVIVSNNADMNNEWCRVYQFSNVLAKQLCYMRLCSTFNNFHSVPSCSVHCFVLLLFLYIQTTLAWVYLVLFFSL